MGNDILKIKNVSKKYGRKVVIDDLSLTIELGQVYGFLGPNGAGKTTTIKMIVGLISIDKGQILINGYDVVKQHKEAMNSVGAIVESPDLYGYLSGISNIKLYARIHNIKKDRINEVIKLVGLEDRIKDKVKKYSLGMKQRLGLAVSLLHKPQLLILDEPTNGLDPAGIKELRDLLKKLAHEENVAIFVSSHMISEVELMCDKVAIIDKGKVITKKDITKQEDEKENVYLLKVSSIEKSMELLTNICKCKIVNGELLIEYDKKISDVIKILMNNGIEIIGFHKKEETLEEQFLDVTGGKK
ncbi:MAG: ABC transporter ATP-binding protein [Clostridia bacterium]|nr:ABC transporter ATP-binding protein [Clostridia bacterium]